MIINSIKRQILDFFKIEYVFEFVKKFKNFLFQSCWNNFDNDMNFQIFWNIVSSCFELLCNDMLSNKKFALKKDYEITLYTTKTKLISKKRVDYE